MQNKKILIIEDVILEALEPLLDSEMSTYLSGKEIYVVSKTSLSKEQKREKIIASFLPVHAVFEQELPIAEMIYQTRFSDYQGILVLTTSKQRVFEAEQMGVDSCFVDRGYNDFCSTQATYEGPSSKQFFKEILRK